MLAAIVFALAAPAVDCQRTADETAWKWNNEAATLGHSALLRQSTYDLRVEVKAAKAGAVNVTFGRDGKDTFTLTGHPHTVFRIDGDTLYYASFHSSASGAKIVAVDLSSGKQLWQTERKGLGPIQHSGYLNVLNVEAGGGTVTIFGNESLGRYVEILDTGTGKTVGHKVFPRDKPVQNQR